MAARCLIRLYIQKTALLAIFVGTVHRIHSFGVLWRTLKGHLLTGIQLFNWNVGLEGCSVLKALSGYWLIRPGLRHRKVRIFDVVRWSKAHRLWSQGGLGHHAWLRHHHLLLLELHESSELVFKILIKRSVWRVSLVRLAEILIEIVLDFRRSRRRPWVIAARIVLK